jgi:uncharacterized protein DUF6786
MQKQEIKISVITKFLAIISLIMLLPGCQQKFEQGTFGHDLEILNSIDDIFVLKNGNAMVAVSGRLQGRVFTSSSKGFKGSSYGWFNRKVIEDGTFNKYYSKLGGEDRMWFGPQYGKYNVYNNAYAESGTILDDKLLGMAPDLDTVNFKVFHKTENEIKSIGRIRLKNHQNYEFWIETERTISILEENEIKANLDIIIPKELSYVGFETVTQMKNIGTENWSRETGLISIWILGCLLPTENTIVIIPTRGAIDSVTNYFSTLNETRMQIKNKIVYYNVDANYLNKIGILPRNTIPTFGSYSPELNLLTIIQFTFDDDQLYVNSHNINQEDPYGGDVINIFNDGIIPTAGPFGPFYELESSSSAKELKVGEALTHKSRIYHFEGSEKHLNEIAKDILGIDLSKRVIF